MDKPQPKKREVYCFLSQDHETVAIVFQTYKTFNIRVANKDNILIQEGKLANKEDAVNLVLDQIGSDAVTFATTKINVHGDVYKNVLKRGVEAGVVKQEFVDSLFEKDILERRTQARKREVKHYVCGVARMEGDGKIVHAKTGTVFNSIEEFLGIQPGDEFIILLDIFSVPKGKKG